MDDLLREFLTESAEHLDTVDTELVRFEQDPNNETILRNIFRLVHTIKGTCGFLGLPRLEALAHAAETLMGRFRDGMPVSSASVTLILATLDRLKAILADLEATGSEPTGADSDLIEALEYMAEHGTGAAPAPAVIVPEIVLPEPVSRELKPGEVTLDDLEAAFLAAPGPDEMDFGSVPALPAPEPMKAEAPKAEAPKAETKVEPQSETASTKVQDQKRPIHAGGPGPGTRMPRSDAPEKFQQDESIEAAPVEAETTSNIAASMPEQANKAASRRGVEKQPSTVASPRSPEASSTRPQKESARPSKPGTEPEQSADIAESKVAERPGASAAEAKPRVTKDLSKTEKSGSQSAELGVGVELGASSGAHTPASILENYYCYLIFFSKHVHMIG